jgi:TPP-dependent trihydroxycyclohexane-1,2-dione (THcHDO) dehydratase
MLGAMRVLADPAETSAVTLALPQDVQAEAYDWPEELFARRVWHIPRPVPEPAALARARGGAPRGRFGTSYRYRNRETGRLDGDKLPIDLAANAESLGAHVIRVKTIDEFREALGQAKASGHTTAIHIETDPLAPVPSSEGWWDVPVSEVAQLESTKQARSSYEAAKARQRAFLAPGS